MRSRWRDTRRADVADPQVWSFVYDIPDWMLAVEELNLGHLPDLGPETSVLRRWLWLT